MQPFIDFVKANILFTALVVGAGVVGLWYTFSPGAISPYQTVLVASTDLVQEVSVTGKVKPVTSVDLGFSMTGRIASVSVRVGDTVTRGQVLVSLENDDFAAKLKEANASLSSAKAKLNELLRGTRPEELTVIRAKVQSDQEALLSALRGAYAAADAAVQVDVDQFITNPHSSALHLAFTTTDSNLKATVESARLSLEPSLSLWRTHVLTVSAFSDLDVAAAEATSVLQQVASLLASAAAALNRSIPNGSVTQTMLDGYAADVASARTAITNELTAISATRSALVTERATLLLEEAGSDPQEIVAQQAAVEVTAAAVSAADATFQKTILLAPFSGFVTRQDAKAGEVVGQTVGASVSLVTVMSSGGFEIETFVPEADIAKLSVGNLAHVTMDAYGEDTIFNARVMEIDIAETVIEGVSTYKVALSFESEPKPVRSGMTANVAIGTGVRSNVFAVPARAVTDQQGMKSVKILHPDGTVEARPVMTGLEGSDGRIEIISGIVPGENVIIYSSK